MVMNNFLGKGVYSHVVLDKFGKAIKKIKYKNIESAVREIAIITIISHPNVIQLEGITWNSKCVDIIMKRYSSDLNTEIQKGRLDSVKNIYMIAHDIISATNYLHNVGIIHCDIKPSNILMDAGKAILCDFGISVVFGEEYYRSNVQTCTYRAPEIDTNKCKLIYKNKIDMWSVGCILYEMCTGQQFVKYCKKIDDSSIYILTAFGLPIMGTRKERLRVLNNINIKFIKTLIAAKIMILSRSKYKKYSNDGFISLISICLYPNIHKRSNAKNALNVIRAILQKYDVNNVLQGVNQSIKYMNLNDNISIISEVSEELISACSRTVIIYAQRIYDRIESSALGSKKIVKSCCIYLSACVFSANIFNIRNIMNQQRNIKNTYICMCVCIMKQIKGHIIYKP